MDVDERIVLVQHLQSHCTLHFHALQAAVLLQRHDQLFFNSDAYRFGGDLLGDRCGRNVARGGGALGVQHLAFGLHCLQEFVGAARLATKNHALLWRGTDARPTVRPAGGNEGRRAHPQVVETIGAHAAHARFLIERFGSETSHAAGGDRPEAWERALRAIPHLVHLVLINLARLLLHHILGVVNLALDYHLVELLLVGVHLRVCLDLLQGYILLVPEGDDLVEREQQVEGELLDGFLVQRLVLICVQRDLAVLRHQF
mmetsp:Transcript_44333/g.73872  ORF Transcript_44333/g.73872 Transcript_44333/m.73872 type:complete len:258 (+) Transcript_44333:1032-1805(+)